MFGDVLALQLIICERLNLDGIVVVPSHYHVAAQWRDNLRFVDPLVEGRFRALDRALEGRELFDRAMLIEQKRVRHLDSDDPCVYEPSVMVHPVSDRLTALFEDPNYEVRADEADRETELFVRA